MCGGRSYTNRDALWGAMVAYTYGEHSITLVSGNASGADMLAESVAAEFGWAIQRFPAKWQDGKSAGPRRNQQMIDEGRPNRAIVAPGGPGTRDMVRRLMENGIPFYFIGR